MSAAQEPSDAEIEVETLRVFPWAFPPHSDHDKRRDWGPTREACRKDARRRLMERVSKVLIDRMSKVLIDADVEDDDDDIPWASPENGMSDEFGPAASAFVDKLLDTRGATILAFAQVEWFLAKIILEAKVFEQYSAVDLSFSQDAEKRATKVKELLDLEGPFSPYADDLRKTIDKVMEYVELRNFAAHGLVVRPDSGDTSLSSKLHFRMFRMYKGGKLDDASRELTIKEYTDEQVGLTKAAREFVGVVRKLWAELKLTQLDPE
jgi:hypothetical protein